MKKIILVIAFLSFCLATNAQTINHLVVAKESMFSIARQYNVSVRDLEFNNFELIKNGLKIGQTIIIPNKKKTLDGQARIINSETIFHKVLPLETKYSITKEYGITIEQLEKQNPEIVNGLKEGVILAINTSEIKPKNDNEELMIALAEKQVALEKIKAKTLEVEDLEDKLSVQKEMNQKVLKVNNLKVNLNAIDTHKGTSADKLKLVLEANINVQDILISKLDSLVNSMSNDLIVLKNTTITDLEETKKLEEESYDNISKTNKELYNLKKDLADNRKSYTELMNKVQGISVEEHQEYKKKLKENRKVKSENEGVGSGVIDEIYKIQENQSKFDTKNSKLLLKIDSIQIQKNAVLKNRISKATFYSEEAREFDDKMALAKIKREKNNVIENNKEGKIVLDNKIITTEEIKKSELVEDLNTNKSANIKVLKNLKSVKSGFYLVVDIFTESSPRDNFIKKILNEGYVNSSFIYDFNIFSYYVYTKYSDKLEVILYDYKMKEKLPNFEKQFILEIRNEN